MKRFSSTLYGCLLATFTLFALIANSIVLFIPFLVFGLIKLVPIRPLRNLCRNILNKLTSIWIIFNNTFIRCTRRITLRVNGDVNYSVNKWYIVISNHQSWLDIVVLQNLLNRKIPNLKFFIKDALKWIPLLGFAWWALDCPYMKRYSKSYLKKYPERKGKDLETTKKACQYFLQVPVAITNFLEGTRFNNMKKKVQNSPYRHLLKPKAGGIAYVIQTMGDKINTIIDVTIIYHKKDASLWDYLSGRIKTISVNVRQITIPDMFLNMDYMNDTHMKHRFQAWLNQRWFEKDSLIELEKSNIDGIA